jgi:uncharacterized protein (DUF1778 family)
MMERTALLVRCTTDEAASIRTEAEKQRRTISGYVLQITVRAIEIEDRLFAKLTGFRGTNQMMSRRALAAPGARTAILVRCNVEEAERIREAARRRDFPINAFILQALKRAWAVDTNPRPAPSLMTEAPRQVNPQS